MAKIIVFGAGEYGKLLGEVILKTQDQLVCFIDNNENIKNVEIKEKSFDVKRITDIKDTDFDTIIISVASENAILSIKEQIVEELSEEVNVKVLVEDNELFYEVYSSCYYQDEFSDKRVSFLRSFAKHCYENNMQGNVAECGVFSGEFSSFINKYFKDRKLYLFDTFEGFDPRDLNKEYEIDANDTFKNGMFSECHFNTNFDLISIVKKRMKYVEQCVIKKGWFPESAKDVNDSFCFVNLDMDLYAPMYEGIKFFYDKMIKGGVILLHDYYHPDLPGVKKAVSDFEKENNIDLVKLPIGDECSMAIIKV